MGYRFPTAALPRIWLWCGLLLLLLPVACRTRTSTNLSVDPESSAGSESEALAFASQAALEAELRQCEKDWLRAYDERDAHAMDAILAENFTITYPNGRVVDKAQTLSWMDPSLERPPGKAQWTEDTQVRLHGDSAVLTGVYVSDQEEDAPSRARYTDTWIRQGGRWRVLASSLVMLPK